MKLRYDTIDRQIIRELPKSNIAIGYQRDIAVRDFKRELEKIFVPILDWLSDKLN